MSGKRAVLYYLDRKIFLNQKKIYYIGRLKKNDIVLDEKTVSRSHAKIFYENKQWFLEDTGSTNGTLINYRRITKTKLHHGDRFMIGPFNCIFRNQSDTKPDFDSLVIDTLMLERKIQEVFNLLKDERGRKKLYDLRHIINKARKRMMDLAHMDRLTGIYNRAYFDTQLSLELERSKRYSQDLYLIMIDIDHFKKFNDTYGHQKGDEVLAAVAGIIRNYTRCNDIVARYGGEEIAVILPQTAVKKAMVTAEKIRSQVQKLSLVQTGMEVTISAGMACGSTADYKPEKLINNTDRALYVAKERGRNRVILYQKRVIKKKQ